MPLRRARSRHPAQAGSRTLLSAVRRRVGHPRSARWIRRSLDASLDRVARDRRQSIARCRRATLAAAARHRCMLLDLAFPLPLPDARDAGTVVVARDGTPLRAFADRGGIWRYPVAPEQVSPLYLQALLNYEDRWFWWHPGINPVALLRAGGQWLRSGRVVSGGSTLTMQVARILDPHRGRHAHAVRQAPADCCARCSSKCTCPSARSSRCTSTARRSAARSKAWRRRAGPTSASRRRGCRTPKPRCSRCCRSRPAACGRIANPSAHASRATRCSRAWRRWACGRAREVADARIEAGGRAFAATAAARRAAGAAPARRSSPKRARIVSTHRPRPAAHARGARRRVLLATCPSARPRRCWWSTTPRWKRVPTSVRSRSPTRRGSATSTWCKAWRSPGSTLKPFLYGLALDDGLIHSESLLVDAPQSFGGYRPGQLRCGVQRSGRRGARRCGCRSTCRRWTCSIASARRVSPRAWRTPASRLQWPRGADAEPGDDPRRHRRAAGGSGRRLRGAQSRRHRRTRALHAPTRRASNAACCRPARRGSCARSSRPIRAPAASPTPSIRAAPARGLEDRHQLRLPRCLGAGRHAPLHGRRVGRPSRRHAAARAVRRGDRVAAAVRSDRQPAARSAAMPRRGRRRRSVAEIEVCWPLGLPPDPQAPQLCQRRMRGMDAGRRRCRRRSPSAMRGCGAPGVERFEVDARSGLRLSAECSAPHARSHAANSRAGRRWRRRGCRRRRAQAARLPPLSPDCARRWSRCRRGAAHRRPRRPRHARACARQRARRCDCRCARWAARRACAGCSTAA